MKRKFKSIGIVFVLVCLLVLILSFPKDTIDSVLMGINIWMYNVFPALFPFFILSDLLINYGFVDVLSELSKNFMRLFGLSGSSSFVLFGSIITGSPSGAKLTKQLLDDSLISVDDANLLIRFTHFSNPLFVIGMIGNVLLNNIKLGYIIFISMILGNLIIGIIFKEKKYIPKEKISFSKMISSIYKKRNSNNTFITTLSKSIYDSFDILILILGIIIVFLIISNIISNFIIDNNLLIIIKGLLEMTQGIKMVSISNLDILIKVILITFFLSFGGLSVHLQVSSIISETKIKYKNFLISRIIHSILSTILVFILFYLFC